MSVLALAPRWLRPALLLAILTGLTASVLPAEPPDAATLAARVREQVAAGDAAGASASIDRWLEEGGAAAADSDGLEVLVALADELSQGGDPALEAAATHMLEGALTAWDAREGASGSLALVPLLRGLSDMRYNAGRYAEAEESDRRTLEIRRRLLGRLHPDVAESEEDLGLTLHQQGRLREAAAHDAEAVSILEALALPDASHLAEALGYQAENLRAMGRLEDATGRMERAVSLFEGARGQSDPTLVDLLKNLAGVHRDANRYAEAERRLRQAQTVAEASGADGSRMAGIWNNLAEIARLSGNNREAEALYLRAIDTARRSLRPDHPRLGTFLNQLAVLYRDQGRLAEAEGLYREALRIRLAALGEGHPDVAWTRHDLGRLLALAGRRAEAEESLRAALAIRERSYGPVHTEVALTLVDLGGLLARWPGREADGRATLDRAVDILARSGDEPEARARALAARSQLSWDEGRRADALRDRAQALDIAERLRPDAAGGERSRARFFARWADDIRTMVSWLVAQGDLEKAFGYTERLRARAFLDQLAAGGVDVRAGIPRAERARLEEREEKVLAALREHRERLVALRGAPGSTAARQGEIAALEKSVSDESTEFAIVYEEILNASPLWRSGRPEPAASMAALRRRTIGTDGLLLVYVIGREASVLLIDGPVHGSAVPSLRSVPLQVDPELAAEFHLPPGALTSKSLETVLVGLDDGPPGVLGQMSEPPLAGPRRPALARRLAALGRTLVPESIRPDLERAREVVVLPDGALHRLPFEALALTPGTRDEDATYWIDRWPPVRYGASATVLDRLGGRTQPPPLRLLSVANPGEEAGSGATGLERLPGAEREADALRAAFAGLGRSTFLSGGGAREPAVLAALPHASIVHLATHGLVDEGRGDLSAALVLAPPPPGTSLPGDDGRLELHEIYALPLGADLVVLSACDTRVGSVVEGEGALALSRGFLAAGARRTLASLWPVDDDAAAELVPAFLRTVAGKIRQGRSPDWAQALQDARRELRRHRSDPFYWAPFVLEGRR